jgi:outer membrane receptor protein involved in Fe transport
MKIKKKGLEGLILAGAFATSIINATGIVAEETSAPSPENKDKPTQIVVTASRGSEQDPIDVPQAISSIGREEIDSSVYTDVDDLIRTTPGLGLAPSEGNPNYWQEGFTIRGLGAQRVLTLTDGVRQAGQGIGYGGGNLSLYDTSSIEKIEVLRGPASVLYGTDAFGGVVNIITREPKRRTESGANGGIGYEFDASRDLNRGNAYVDFGDENYSAIVGGSYTDASEPNLPDDEDPNGGSFKNKGIWGKLDYYLDGESKIRLIGNYDRNEDVIVTDQSITLPIAKFPPPGAMSMITSPLYFEFPLYSRSLLGAEYESTNLDDCWEYFKTGIYWQNISREFHRETAFYPTGSPGFAGPPLFVNPAATVTTSTVDTNDDVNTYEWQTQARYGWEDHTFTFGLDVGYDTNDLPETETQKVVAQAGIGAVNGPTKTIERKRADADQTRVGIYAQDSIPVNSWEFIPGIRGDLFSINNSITDYDETEFGLSGSLGAVYKVDNNNSYYGSLASGFRVPDLGERFQNGIVNLGAPTRIIGKENLDPERALTAEVGTKNRSGDFSYEAAVYYSDITDYIGVKGLGFVDGFVTEQYDNLGDVALYGGEAGMTYQATENMDLFANVSRTWTDDPEKIDVMSWVFNYGARYAQPLDNEWFETITPTVVARTVLESEDKTVSPGREQYNAGSFTVVDLSVAVDLKSTDLGKGKLIAGVKNILNRTYQEPFFPQNQPERSVFASVKFDF